MKNFIDSLRTQVADGMSMNDAIEKLYEHNLTIVETMSFLVSEYDVSLAKAKAEVTNSHVWSSVVESSRILQDEIVDALDNNQPS